MKVYGKEAVVYIMEKGGNAAFFSIHTMLKHFTAQSRLLTTLKEKAIENIARKGENAGNQHFLLFPQCFQPYQRQISSF